MRCGWCETNNKDRDNCVNCGGPLPHPGALGPPPPPSPRVLPARFGERVLRPASFDLAFLGLGVGGAALFCLGAPLFPPFLAGPLLCAPFALVGAYLGWSRRNRGKDRIETLERGVATVGTVQAVSNEGPSQWRLTYAFDLQGTPRTAEVTSTDAEITRFEPGGQVHVVVRDATHSDLWPPMA
jgi:hypothetical protein